MQRLHVVVIYKERSFLHSPSAQTVAATRVFVVVVAAVDIVAAAAVDVVDRAVERIVVAVLYQSLAWGYSDDS